MYRREYALEEIEVLWDWHINSDVLQEWISKISLVPVQQASMDFNPSLTIIPIKYLTKVEMDPLLWSVHYPKVNYQLNHLP